MTVMLEDLVAERAEHEHDRRNRERGSPPWLQSSDAHDCRQVIVEEYWTRATAVSPLWTYSSECIALRSRY